MLIYARGRRMGKTTDLISVAAEGFLYVVVPDRRQAMLAAEMAESMDLDIPFPLTWDEFANGRFRGSGVNGFVIDNLDMCVQSMARGTPVRAVSLTTEPGEGPDLVRVNMDCVLEERVSHRLAARRVSHRLNIRLPGLRPERRDQLLRVPAAYHPRYGRHAPVLTRDAHPGGGGGILGEGDDRLALPGAEPDPPGGLAPWAARRRRRTGSPAVPGGPGRGTT